jgi:ZIP family zinc transporter
MQTVLVTAFAVGGATVLGALLGFFLKGLTDRFSDGVLSFAAGVMLSSAIVGLIVPAISYDGLPLALSAPVGVFSGALFLFLIDRFLPYPSVLEEEFFGERSPGKGLDRGLLFVLAIAIHNLPEGIAAGVGFGTGDKETALFIAGSIALQNLPEGMVIVAPMLASGFSRKKTFFCAAGTGILEIIGTFIGYFAVREALVILPFSLAFAGGLMLYVVIFQMIPESRRGRHPVFSAFALLSGVLAVLLADHLLG